MLRRLLIVFATAAGLAACATAAPPYTPAAAPGGVGYSETQIEGNRYFVTYRARRAMEESLLQDYALLRAADITLQNGRDWFRVDRHTVDTTSGRSSYGPSVGIGVGTGSYGRRSGTSVGVGVNFPLGGNSTGARAQAATLEIRLGEGVKPDETSVYDARSVAASLRARLQAPR